MAVRKLKPIEERDPYAALVLDAFDRLEEIPVREGAQYGEGVAGGELRENLYELPKRNHRPRHDDGQRDGYKLEEGSAHAPDVEHGPNAIAHRPVEAEGRNGSGGATGCAAGGED